jgi:hypothetical protein
MKSQNYRDQLIPIKKKLMEEIASYFTNERFNMKKRTLIFFQQVFGNFPADFDYVDGNKYKFCLYSNDAPYAALIRFDVNVNYCVEREITFLMELLDYIDNDSKR